MADNSHTLSTSEYELIAEYVILDTSRRLRIPKAGAVGQAYNVYKNPQGRLLLEPVVAVPVQAWQAVATHSKKP
jgi:hypothetical protein